MTEFTCSGGAMHGTVLKLAKLQNAAGQRLLHLAPPFLLHDYEPMARKAFRSGTIWPFIWGQNGVKKMYQCSGDLSFSCRSIERENGSRSERAQRMSCLPKRLRCWQIEWQDGGLQHREKGHCQVKPTFWPLRIISSMLYNNFQSSILWPYLHLTRMSVLLFRTLERSPSCKDGRAQGQSSLECATSDAFSVRIGISLRYRSVLSNWECFIKMNVAFLALSFLHKSREDRALILMKHSFW